MPNTRLLSRRLRVVRGPTLTWLTPLSGRCLRRTAQLAVSAGATKRIRAVRFFDGKRQVKVVRRGAAGLYITSWRTRGVKPGRHQLRAVLQAGSQRAEATRTVRVCR